MTVESVAIVIPCFNYGRFLVDAVGSALEQTRPVDEVIVVDDGSTDSTPDVIAKLGDSVSSVRQPNRGLAAARNTGARAASSSHVVFLDADDRLDKTYVERCVAAFEARPTAKFVTTQFRYFGEEEGESSFPPFSAHWLRDQNIVHASAMLERAVVLKYPYDERIRSALEDWDFYMTLAENGCDGVLVDEPLLEYRQHGGSMIREAKSRWLRWYAMHWYLLAKHLRFFGARGTVRRARDLALEERRTWPGWRALRQLPPSRMS